ncbi:hypothetical protein KM043_018022 [Ampulex compressa]|nr:hypothetical protein KM043_018022 [Ampulex compressa]
MFPAVTFPGPGRATPGNKAPQRGRSRAIAAMEEYIGAYTGIDRRTADKAEDEAGKGRKGVRAESGDDTEKVETPGVPAAMPRHVPSKYGVGAAPRGAALSHPSPFCPSAPPQQPVAEPLTAYALAPLPPAGDWTTANFRVNVRPLRGGPPKPPFPSREI